MPSVALSILGDEEKFRRRATFDFLRQIPDVADLSPIALANELDRRGPLGQSLSEKLRTADTDAYERELSTYAALDVDVIPLTDSRFPPALALLETPPLVLYCRGRLPRGRSIAVIGTREISREGEIQARSIATRLSGAGFIVVSGLALGTDTAVHRGTLEANGVTVAVLPGSITQVVPRENAALAEEIVANRGCLVAELTSQKPIHKGRFIQRNRITSGLASSVVAIESDATGGSVHQVDYARKQGKAVFALRPLPSNARGLRGFERFTSEGAVAIDGPTDLLLYLLGKVPLPGTKAPLNLDSFLTRTG